MSKIKGGGRAQLSQEAEESIISLLYDLRDYENPLLPAENEDNADSAVSAEKSKKSHRVRQLYTELSEHDMKKERKRFLKKLLKAHNRLELSKKFNEATSSEFCTDSASTEIQVPVDKPSAGDVADVKRNVRIELIEMIFKEKKDKPPKDKKKSSKKEKKKSCWKEGTKKLIVLPRNTSIKELMVQCKGKMKMKKVQRIFMIDKDSSLEIDLEHDLRGVQDGSTVYATSHILPRKDIIPDKKEKDESHKEEDVLVFDPLENVKKAYRMTRNRNEKKSGDQFINKGFPPFIDAINELEPLSESRSKLPAAKYRSEILKSMDTSRVIIIAGATGCGKSTQVPQYILEGMKAINCGEQANIIVTQPRRVAAMALAKRVAEERNLPPPGRDGSEVGYNVRFARAVSKDSKIVYCTVGVLLRMIVNPKESYGDEDENGGTQASIPLSSISTCVIDEVHERDLTTDFALTLLRPLLAVNKRINIVLMSATASTSLFVNFFRDMKVGIEPKVFNIPGRTFPVETKWLIDCEKFASSSMNGWSRLEDTNELNSVTDEGAMSPRAKAKIDNEFITKIILNVANKQWNAEKEDDCDRNKTAGSILVFLPGKGEIEALMQTLIKDPRIGNKSKCSIFKLYSTMPPSEQWRAFQPVKVGVVKIVLATNVAETSITIPDISVVIDTGRVKEMRFNSSTRIKELVTVWTSQASSKQRAGRAGRTGPGVCYKLYSEEFVQRNLPLQTSPEIMRTPLEDLILQVCLLEEQKNSDGIDPAVFLANAPEPPPKSNLQQACLHLQEIGALTPVPSGNNVFRLTPLGYHLSHLPMDAKVGKILVVGCILQCIEPALTVAATLSAPKSVWLSFIPGKENSGQKARIAQEDIIHNGFGGTNWPGGDVKGDAIASIAAYNAWISSATSSESHPEKQRRRFASEHGLSHNALTDIKGLRNQFKDALRVSGLLRANQLDNVNGDDPLLTSCCLVAGLYPNIATLMRPSREMKIRGGFLITKDGDRCRPSSDSFQRGIIQNAREGGKDAYAVYHGKHRTIGTSSNDAKGDRKRVQDPFLSNINFVNRFAILLFGGSLEISKNCVIVDEWLKFKVDDADKSKSEKVPVKGHVNVVLINELRKELDNVLLRHIMKEKGSDREDQLDKECQRVIQVVRQILVASG